MRKPSIILSFVLAAATMPTFAGGAAFPSSGASQEVLMAQMDARSVASAQTKHGVPASAAHASAQQKTRAEVHAEAVAWTKSGMGEMVYGEVPFDSRGPSFDRAAQSFQQFRQEQATRATK